MGDGSAPLVDDTPVELEPVEVDVPRIEREAKALERGRVAAFLRAIAAAAPSAALERVIQEIEQDRFNPAAIVPPLSEVPGLLQQSVAAHATAKQLRRNGKQSEARVALQQAADARLAALAADPERADPAWQDEQRHTAGGHDTHESLMAFYRQQGVIGG